MGQKSGSGFFLLETLYGIEHRAVASCQSMFNPEESLTHDEILRRFRKVMGREMTPEEKRRFFLPPDHTDTPNPDKQP